MAGRPVKIDEQGTPDVSVDSRQVGTADGVPVVRQIVSLGAGDAPDAIIDTTGGTVPVSGTVAVTGTQGDSLTDAELRATAVPVSGTVAVTGTQDDSLTDTQLRATAVPVSGTVTVSNPTADPETGLATSVKQLPDGHAVAVTFPASQTVDGTVTVANPTADPETGLATSAKQLPDGHAVAVSNDPATISLTPSTASLTSAAALTISPSAGTEALRLWWVSVIPDPDNADTGYATVAVGSTEVYRSPALAHRQRFDGAAGEDIVVAIVGAGTFLATVHYLEFTP
jgi:hypothetical protein